jgi:hypothetical protein
MKDAKLSCAVACLSTGSLREGGGGEAVTDELLELAATLPEIFGTFDRGCLERIAERLGAEPGATLFTEVLLLSETRVHVVRPLETRPGEALLAVGPVGTSVGLTLSQVHARASALEEAP